MRLSSALVIAVYGMGCTDPGTLAPEATPVLTTLEVSPATYHLSAVAPGNSVHLKITARDQDGAAMPGTGATFSSAHPAIARVSDNGTVTGVAPGSTVITTTLSHGGITRTATMAVTVHAPTPGEVIDLTGVYYLTGTITGSDPAWGIAGGTLQTAVLTIRHSPTSSWFTGSYPEFCATDSSGRECSRIPGVVTGVIGVDGRVVIELTNQGSASAYFHGEGAVIPGRIVGTYGAGGHISGAFVAERTTE